MEKITMQRDDDDGGDIGGVGVKTKKEEVKERKKTRKEGQKKREQEKERGIQARKGHVRN